MKQEDAFVILMARNKFSESERQLFSDLVNSNLDWEYVFEQALQEGVVCFLRHHLRHVGVESGVPAWAKERATQIYYQNVRHNCSLSQEATSVLEVLGEEEVEAIVLKGIFLSEHIYHNIALRPVRDLDLLIRKKDLARADKALTGLGFIACPQARSFISDPGSSSINSLMYQRSGGEQVIHLHWHLINSTWPLELFVRAIDMDRIWYNARACTIGTCRFLTLAPHHLLIYLSVHALCHYFNKLILLVDIREVMDAYQESLDWDLLIAEADGFLCLPAVYYALYLTSRLLKKSVSRLEDIASILKKSGSGFVLQPTSESMRSYGFCYKAFFLMQDSITCKTGFIYRTLFPSRYVMAHNFNISSSEVNFVHYAKRIASQFACGMPHR